MNSRWQPLLAALVLSTLAGTSAAARPSKEAKTSKKTLASLDPNGTRFDLLSGRLSIAMPKETRDPSAGSSRTDESWLTLEVGQEKLVMIASELSALSGGDLPQDADAILKVLENTTPMTREKLALPPGLKGLALIPTHPSSDQDANLVMAVLAAREDGSLIFLRFFVNPPGAKKLAPLTQRLRAMARSLQPGTRRLETGAGPRALAPDPLTIDVPEGFVRTTQGTDDFRVHQLRRLGELGKTPEGCGVYVGPLPSPFSHPPDTEEKPIAFRAKLLGAETDWQRWTTPVGTMEESITPYPGRSETSIHVFCIASDDRLPALHAMVETLKPTTSEP